MTDYKKTDDKNRISIRGARVNNLKNISLDIPRDKLVVISGISGSGKSSLAFDTLFAEGQRRFAESLSSFARQFLGRMVKPAVDDIKGIPPAIAIEQKVNSHNPRSTVGTITEIYDYMRLLYAKTGHTYSPVSGREVKIEHTDDVVKYVRKFASKIKKEEILYVCTDFGWKKSKDRVEKLIGFREAGFSRLADATGKEIKALRMDSVLTDIKAFDKSDLHLLIGRFMLEPSSASAPENETIDSITDSIRTAFETGDGKMEIFAGDTWRVFSNRFEEDGITFDEPNELLFSYNNPLGACPECNGSGMVEGIDENLVVPDPTMSVYEGAIACWRGEVMKRYLEKLILSAEKFGFPIHRPYEELTAEQKETLWKGNEYFTGINGFFDMVRKNRYKIQFKYMLAKYTGKTTCPVCHGSRLRKEAGYVKIGGKTISELMNTSIDKLSAFFDEIKLNEYEKGIAGRILVEIKSRLGYIKEVGLGYLTLNRTASSLSGGESQRINLASSLGSSLVGSLYILDEPSIGLHPRDTDRLISVIKSLRDLGNTVIIVEHDKKIITSADRLIDIGPYAGTKGGKIVYEGTIAEGLEKCKNAAGGTTGSLTLDYIGGLRKINIPETTRHAKGQIRITGCREHNLKNINVNIPLGIFTVITGVSGSGKSTLIGDTLYPALGKHFGKFGAKPGAYRQIEGNLEDISDVEYIDQSPIGKSSRSNPVTYLKIYDDIRDIFSQQPYAKMNGYGHSFFSFNIDGGRCPQCLGEGYITIPMQFMADVRIVCEECGGKRFKPDILEVKFHGKNINDVLEMSVSEAIEFFGSQKEEASQKVASKLQVLADVGLEYIKLGQNSNTLSGGESQRIKLAQFLGNGTSKPRTKTGGILFIFDEPTTGLHFYDIDKLLGAFEALLDRGHSVIVIEHNTDVIKAADWVIDLGPEGGEGGGEICFEGTPGELALHKDNYTGKALSE